jgi:hypothetical protein
MAVFKCASSLLVDSQGGTATPYGAIGLGSNSIPQSRHQIICSRPERRRRVCLHSFQTPRPSKGGLQALITTQRNITGRGTAYRRRWLRPVPPPPVSGKGAPCSSHTISIQQRCRQVCNGDARGAARQCWCRPLSRPKMLIKRRASLNVYRALMR